MRGEAVYTRREKGKFFVRQNWCFFALYTEREMRYALFTAYPIGCSEAGKPAHIFIPYNPITLFLADRDLRSALFLLRRSVSLSFASGLSYAEREPYIRREDHRTPISSRLPRATVLSRWP